MKTNQEPRSWLRRRALAALVALALAAAACGTADDGAGANPLAGSHWEATSLYTGTTMEGTHPTTIVTIVFGSERAEGYDGCNRYVVPYGVDGDRVTFGEISSTGGECRSAEHTTQADAFLNVVRAVTRFNLSGNGLEMGSEATDLLRLRRADDLLLTGISWLMTGYRAPNGGRTSPLDGAPVSLWFGSDGSIVGSTGCNSYSAHFQQSGAELAIRDLAHTEMVCSEPAGVMDQEAEYLALLLSARAFRTDLTTLELLDADSGVIAAFAFGGRTR